jgi:hypothetical protein
VGQPNKHCIMVKSMNGLTQEKREASSSKDV